MFYELKAKRQGQALRDDSELSSSSSIAYSARAAITHRGLWSLYADDCDKLYAITPYSASASSFLEIFLMADICSILTWLAASLASEHRHHVSRPMVFGRARHWLPCKPPQPQRQLAVAGREAAKSDAGYPPSKVWARDRSGPAFWSSGFLVH
jgi:hypothetical protein